MRRTDQMDSVRGGRSTKEPRMAAARLQPLIESRRWRVFVCCALVVVLSAVSQGQETRRQDRSRKKGQTRVTNKGLSPAEALVRRFDRTAPQLGDPVPDVTGFDADGKEFKLRSLRGKYTVLTFGCLT